jgi:hypothetical protein
MRFRSLKNRIIPTKPYSPTHCPYP